MVDLSIIIVSFNAKTFLKECLGSIAKNVSDKLSYEIIVIDNASKDETTAMIHKEFPVVKLIENENEGFSKANNRGVKIAKGRYILFLNADTLVYENTIEGMIAFMDEYENVGAATCTLEMPGGGIDYASHRGFPTPWNAFCFFSGLNKLFPKVKLFSGYTLGWMNLHTKHEIDALAGAFMLVRRSAGDAVGWWDEDYFFNGEDIDFCFRLKQKGWKIFYVPKYAILHYGGISGGTKKHSTNMTTADRETKIRATNARFDAMKIFYKKHYVKKYPRFLTWLVIHGVNTKQWLILRRL